MTTQAPVRFSPASKKQKVVLTDTTTDVILTGGGAGGGKSATCLMKNLDGINDPEFRCTIFRRTNPELTRQGGLIDESRQFYAPFGGVYKIQAKTWVFPSGATIQFAAFPDESAKGGWQGSQLGRVLIDEVGDKWSEDSVIFLLSRLRATRSSIHPQLIMTCNPDSDSFLYDWLKDWALDPDTGVAYEGVENRIRWFANISNKMYWDDDPETLFETVGKPLGMIDARKLSPREIQRLPVQDRDKLFYSKSFRFIPATVKCKRLTVVIL